MTPAVVADASPLIALQQVGSLQLLERLFVAVEIPPAVAHEIAPSVPPQPWIKTRALAQPMAPLVLRGHPRNPEARSDLDCPGTSRHFRAGQ